MKTLKPVAWLVSLATLVSALNAGAAETAIVKDGRVNVRGQPALAGEVITQLQKGEKVVVLEEIQVAKPKTNEPPRWARIQMPPNTPVWVFAPFLDLTNKTVKVTRLNLRAGPGENYSVVGRLQRGAPVTEIRRVDEWMEIETPPGAYGFVAANLLTKGEEIPASAVAKVEPKSPAPVSAHADAPSPAPVVKSPEMPATNTVTKAKEPPPRSSPPPPAVPPQVPSAAPLPAVPPADKTGDAASTAASETVVHAPAAPEPSTKVSAPPVASRPAETPVLRVVRHEGIVRSTASIQAPTYYELLSAENHKAINYLHVDKLDLDLKDYRGRRVIVTGEEAIDPRWPKTPVIEVDSLELIP